MPTATWPMPDQESSQVRSAWSTRSYEGIEHPANPSAGPEELAAQVEHGLVDHLGGLEENRLRDSQPQRLGSLEVDHEFKLSGLLNWQVSRLGTF